MKRGRMWRGPQNIFGFSIFYCGLLDIRPLYNIMRQMGIYRLDPPLVPVVSAPAALELEAGDALEVHHLEHLLGLGVDLDDVLLEGGDVGHVVVPPLPLLLLQLDGDAAHRRPLQPLHEMRDEAGDLVAQRLRGDQGDLETDGNGYKSH